MVAEYYDFRRGWNDTKPGWYLCRITPVKLGSFYEPDSLYREIITWLYTTIDECERHVRWSNVDASYTPMGSIEYGNTLCVKFRYERDYNWFAIRWL